MCKLLERLLIGKLQVLCGAQFVSKMAGMLTDLSVTVEQQQHWLDEVAAMTVAPSVSLSVRVLTTGHWPAIRAETFNLSQELVPICSQYEE